MGLIKAQEVELIPHEEDDFQYPSPESSELEEDDSSQPSYIAEHNVKVISQTVVIGDPGIVQKPLTQDVINFFNPEDTQIIINEPIIIGGELQTSSDYESDYYDEDLGDYETDDYATDDYGADDYGADDYATDDYATDDYATDDYGADDYATDDYGADDYATDDYGADDYATDDYATDDGLPAEGEEGYDPAKSSVFQKVDSKVKELMDEQRLALQDQSAEELSFMSEAERQKIMGEAKVFEAPMPDFGGSEVNYEENIQSLTQYIDTLAMEHRESMRQKMDSEREQMTKTVEEYIHKTLDEQRNMMQKDAEGFVSQTVDAYKEQLNEDNDFIKAAMSIISQRDTMLTDAQEKAMLMLQEAEAEASRYISDATVHQDQAEAVMQEAEQQSEAITQEAQNEAEQIISESNMESARIIEAAEQSHQEIVEAATQDGFNVGYQEGREEAIKENAQLLMETTNALNKLHAAFPEVAQQNEDKLIKLCVEIARAVIQEELRVKPEHCLKGVERAIHKVSDIERVIIKVNPLDLDIILPKTEFFRGILPDVQEFVITGHYSIERGGCAIETNSGSIDSQVSAQLGVIEEVFKQIRDEYDVASDDADEEEDEDEEE